MDWMTNWDWSLNMNNVYKKSLRHSFEESVNRLWIVTNFKWLHNTFDIIVVKEIILHE